MESFYNHLLTKSKYQIQLEGRLIVYKRIDTRMGTRGPYVVDT